MQSPSDNNPPLHKRARIACHLCHERKVRCDTSLVGTPCTNCRIDNHLCTVRNTSTRRPKKRLQALGLASLPVASEILAASVPADGDMLPDLYSWEASGEGDDNVSLSGSRSVDFLLGNTSGYGPSQNATLPMEGRLSPFPSPLFDIPPSMSKFWPPFIKDLGFNTSVTFSYYRFLEVRGLAALTPNDVRYLESKGCLHVPSGPHIDQFIRHYFLHVHPCMPILNEGHFWDMYSNSRDDKKGTETISLLVFQAMLFAATSHLPLNVIQSCGFRDFYAARKSFYERAKLLYNFRTENDFTAIAQASLLLSFESTPHGQQDNTSWLSVAIQNARADNVHIYHCLPGLTVHQTRDKKRLWWCCILRDRVISLGVRRPLQITLDHFDFSGEGLTELDFEEEVERSQVYDTQTKWLLARTFIVQCQFAVAVTSTVMAIYPLNGVVMPAKPTPTQLSTLRKQIEESRRELGKWMEMSRSQLTHSPEETGAPHDSVTLYTELTYIYYFSAQIAQCHYSMFVINKGKHFMMDYAQQLNAIRIELERAIVNMTSKVTNIVSLGLVGYLPISVIAYTALPLALLCLDVRFSSTNSQKASRQQRLGAYMETMKQCGHRFKFADVVSSIVSKLLQLVDFTQRTISPSNNFDSSDTSIRISKSLKTCPRSWVDFVNTQPQLYFRLSISLDFALSKGKYPSEGQLPGWIINLSLPSAPAKPVNSPPPTNCVSTISSSTNSIIENNSLIRESGFNRPQHFHFPEPSSPSPHTSFREYHNGNGSLDGAIFELENSTERGFLLGGRENVDERNEDNNSVNSFGDNMLLYFSDIPATGG